MPFHDRFRLPRDNQQDVDPVWFEQQKQRSVQSDHLSLRNWLDTDVDALKSFHDDHINADEAALSMTYPISTSPVPSLGGYSDDTLAIGNLWRLIVAALIEWPPTRIPEIFALLGAIAKAPGYIHKGEALDDDGGKLTWASYPYFGMIWHESTGADIQPGQICRQYFNSALGLLQARKLYLKMKDIEAQLVAKQVLAMNKTMIQLIIRALEKGIDESDEQLAPGEASGYKQVKLDFHIPAIAYMFRYNERKVYEQVVTKGLRDWPKRQLPDGAREFQNGAERWSFWRRRLAELSRGIADDEVKAAAQASLEYMSPEVWYDEAL
jgi:hypothetical protein